MRSSLHRRFTAPIAIAAIAGLTLAGCSGGPGSTTTDAGAAGDGTVTVYGTIGDTEAKLLEESWAGWEKENKIDIQYEASKEFETQIAIRAQGGNAPDIAIFPQPGLMADLASRDYLKPAPKAVEANVDKYWSADWKAYGTVGDTLYGAPLMASVKGFIWYSPAKFKEWGVEVPKTWADLLAVTKTIQEKTGAAPWCAGFGSGDATGWPGTDWVEDLVLRQAGPETYDKWIKNEIPFTDPAIKKAFDSVGEILQNPAYVNAGFGDVRSINSTPFGDVAAPLADGTCALHHQASFFDGFITDAGGKVGPDGDVWAFITPGEEAGSQAVTGGGEIVAAFADDADTQKVQEYLSSADWANSRVSLGGVISANSGLDPANAKSPILQEAIKILQDPKTTFRFDGSDLMPGSVGSGTFWKGMVNWINGTPTDEVLTSIEAGWPSS
ncbi:carbohydrate ABC transporter substrate-binding protein [Cryobacterium sp. TMT1-21]|uniref:ABC transporter substrate-binding protein n=1 Tax=unclassified Cryobacterium TaxID=2649013 RepID=UPI00106C78CA|nr:MULTISPECIES: ABC transporter substrate-binding protein [unclassified Cryobacterium]TFC86233.1 carbohydrate ABC transporter substrate-binding protein [Cryobacterium sp. TmT2-59]TFD12675.1 carbohydrate ABC transporter substrate-binding protein [Cryobacterium sp. TMT1-21]TFD17402.1 carbohydrate ABC transporter substrate-binding protein [Cryobacterium sp. TMT4-10]TFD41157.1 carbohydrate ABC transporter substrate-binding protein [Cryobacterium sp. TMT2-10]